MQRKITNLYVSVHIFMANRHIIFTLLTCCLLFMSCYVDHEDVHQRSDEERAVYVALNDSMTQMKPGALAQIEEQMRKSTDSLTWYDYYLMYGRHYLMTSHPDSTLPYAYRTIQFVNRQEYSTPRTRGLAATAHNTIASYYYLLHQSRDTIFAHYHEAYRLLMESDMKQNLPDISANIADAYVLDGRLPEATRWYRRALFLNDSLGMPESQALTLYMGLGRIYTSLGDYNQAGDYYRQTSEHLNMMKPNMQSYFLNNYGNYYYFRKDYHKALLTFRQLESHLIKYHAEENFDMYLCKINLADVYLNLNNTDSARYYVTEAEDYFTKHQVDVGIYYAHTIRIGIALREKNYEAVRRIIQEEKGLQVNDIDMNNIRNRYMNHYYAAIGDYRRAYSGLQDNIEQEDSTENVRKRMRVSDFMVRFAEDTIRLHHQLALNEQKIENERTKSALWLILGLLIILILSILIWVNQERKRKLQHRLDMLNLRLLNARQRISPHFVFNVINSRINKTDQQEADQLMMLAKLIRTNLDITHNPYITLAEELDFVKQYVDLERILMGEDFDFRMEVPSREVLESITIPSMLIQILTENAMIHGLKNTPGNKLLTIHVETDEVETRISVIDNGPGFDLQHYGSDRSRTGLNIIRSTIQSINQENKLKMHFHIHNDHGCQATITIPKHLKFI